MRSGEADGRLALDPEARVLMKTSALDALMAEIHMASLSDSI